MVLAAGIAFFFIFGLFLSMLSSSPDPAPDAKSIPDTHPVKDLLTDPSADEPRSIAA